MFELKIHCEEWNLACKDLLWKQNKTRLTTWMWLEESHFDPTLSFLCSKECLCMLVLGKLYIKSLQVRISHVTKFCWTLADWEKNRVNLCIVESSQLFPDQLRVMDFHCRSQFGLVVLLRASCPPVFMFSISSVRSSCSANTFPRVGFWIVTAETNHCC